MPKKNLFSDTKRPKTGNKSSIKKKLNQKMKLKSGTSKNYRRENHSNPGDMNVSSIDERTEYFRHLDLIPVTTVLASPEKVSETSKYNEGFSKELIKWSNSKDKNLRFEKISMALQAKADPNFLDEKGFTPLYYLVKNKDIESVRLLLAYYKADPNYLYGNELETVLHISVKTDDVKMLELLCEYGADIILRNKLDQTPLQLAKANDKWGVIKKLSKLEKEQSILNQPEEAELEVLCDFSMPVETSILFNIDSDSEDEQVSNSYYEIK